MAIGEPEAVPQVGAHPRRLVLALPLVAVAGLLAGLLAARPDTGAARALGIGAPVLLGLLVVAATTAVRRAAARQRDDVQRAVAAALDLERRAAEELARAEALKAQLLSVVSHEFRTPLTGILGFSRTLQAQIAAGTASPELAATALDRIQRGGSRLSRLVGNMLAVATDVDPVVAEARPLLPAVGRVVRDLAATLPDPPPVEVDVPADLVVRTSAAHLDLVLTNLVDNAMKFAEPGTRPTIRARAVGDAVAITTANDGPPIPQAMRERIFAPFVQVDSSDSRRYEGLGLGLHVVRKVAAAYGGELELVCQGRTVVLAVTLPASVGGRLVPGGPDRPGAGRTPPGPTAGLRDRDREGVGAAA